MRAVLFVFVNKRANDWVSVVASLTQKERKERHCLVAEWSDRCAHTGRHARANLISKVSYLDLEVARSIELRGECSSACGTDAERGKKVLNAVGSHS